MKILERRRRQAQLSDPEIIVATVVGVFLVAAFLSADWICGGSWRD